LKVLEEDVCFERVEEFFVFCDEGGEERADRGCTVLAKKGADSSKLNGETDA
jgi:hypothetical protein